jgi:hypothetical protein
LELLGGLGRDLGRLWLIEEGGEIVEVGGELLRGEEVGLGDEGFGVLEYVVRCGENCLFDFLDGLFQ